MYKESQVLLPSVNGYSGGVNVHATFAWHSGLLSGCCATAPAGRMPQCALCTAVSFSKTDCQLACACNAPVLDVLTQHQAVQAIVTYSYSSSLSADCQGLGQGRDSSGSLQGGGFVCLAACTTHVSIVYNRSDL